GSRRGVPYGEVTLLDHLAHDGLHDVFTDQSMGALTDAANADAKRHRFGRAEQDAYAVGSHQRAAAAWKNGVVVEEVVPVSVPRPKGGPVQVDGVEGVGRDPTVESLDRLRPAFQSSGTRTAGSSSQLSDVACAVVVMSEARAAELGVAPLPSI